MLARSRSLFAAETANSQGCVLSLCMTACLYVYPWCRKENPVNEALVAEAQFHDTDYAREVCERLSWSMSGMVEQVCAEI